MRIEAISCTFPFAVIALLGITHVWRVPGVARYDVLFVGCVLVQWLMVRSRLETISEAKAVAMFHVVGLALELFKVRMGSWSYPDAGYLRIGAVPLFSGFMYAAVGSYVCQAWKRFDLRVHDWPTTWKVWACCAAAYLNFFTHHFLPDLRWFILLAVVFVFRRTEVSYALVGTERRMSMLAAFICIATAVWIAENIGTWLGAWQYPYQSSAWQMVDFGKLSSWTMLVIISVVLVAQLKLVKRRSV